MLETVTKGFKAARERLRGAPDARTVDAAIKDIRLSLLEADVDLGVAKAFLERVRARALEDFGPQLERQHTRFERDGRKETLTPYHRFVAICQEELERLMGGEAPEVQFAPMGVTAIMMVGLQGSGKTTTSAKLARHFREREGKKVMLVAADLQRPAAVEQLQRLGDEIDVPVFSKLGGTPLELCGEALARAGKTQRDVVIFDTAGRLTVDEALMEELRLIQDRTKPQEVLLVVDAMVGQDAVRTAQAFDEALGVTGFVMTKLDGDARGGAALSIREITHKPIKFLGMGEDSTALEAFRPEGLASRILGMGDVVGLVQEFERHVDPDKAEEDAERMFRGQFDMADFVEQIRTLQQMGSFEELFSKMPMFQEGMKPDERELLRIVAVHDSMTPLERRRPALARDPSRLRRLGRGCGLGEPGVTRVLDKFDAMRRMMIALGDQPSLLAKLPGFGEVAQVRKLRGLDLGEIFGDAFAQELQEPDEPEPPPEPDRPKREYFAHLAKPTGAGRGGRGKQQKKKKKMAQKSRKRNRR
ncbi:MAG TPA: signal recognition particle receptor subunit alpha [Myxococcales bacterium LLY-WYZ-16_1]|nr:signal recognition particle receptor subunit alpha [Myxococcales bacterium LLY-WYZ-16_1]